jgi:hypothetical protein
LRQDSKRLPTWNRSTRANRSSQTFISCLIDDLNWALSYLHGPTDNWKQVEAMAIFVHESQSSDSRGFHTVERVFDVSGGAAPVQLVAAFFRHTVHHYIGAELSVQEREKLKNVFVKEKPNTYELCPLFLEDDLVRMVADIFGLKAHDDLEHVYKWKQGMDIFLSAIMVVQFLRDVIDKKQLCEIVVCMEGTIPFRPMDDMGRNPIDLLYTRLEKANQSYDLGMTEFEMERTCQMAVDLHNRIMGTFSTPDPERFVDYTWSLLPEQYESLRRTDLYSLSDFYFAVWDMQRFVAKVDRSLTCASFRGIPQQWEIQEFQNFFSKNQTLGVAYLKVKTLEVALIMALATLTGGANVPKSLFYGDLKHQTNQENISASVHKQLLQEKTPSLGDGLPYVNKMKIDPGCNSQVFEILNSGRSMESSFDKRNAPVATFVYGKIGESGLSTAFEQCVHPMTEESSWKVLLSLPYHVVEVVGREVANMAPSRAEFIEEVLEDIVARDSVWPGEKLPKLAD